MSRSERHIARSDEELRRLKAVKGAAEQFDRQREALLRTALKNLNKADLVEATLRVVQTEKAGQWRLEEELNLDKPVELLVHDIEAAIDIATKVDDRRLNYNFPYDRRAYDAARRGLLQLIEKGGVDQAKSIALKLMKKGFYQIECSDEGLMQEHIESCLRPVISAVAGSSGAREWALQMLRHGRFLCEQQLVAMARGESS